MIAKRQDAVKVRSAPKHTPAGAALTALIVPLIRLDGHFTRAGEVIAGAAGQTLARWLTMDMVAERPATVAQVARQLGYTRQSVQRVADLLEQDGLTAYVDNPAHQRSKLIRLTPRGRQALRTIQEAQRRWANAVGAQIGEANLRQASHVVELLTGALSEQPR